MDWLLVKLARTAATARYFGLMLSVASLGGCSAAPQAAAPTSGGSPDWIEGALAEDEWVEVDTEDATMAASPTISGWPLGGAATSSHIAAQPATSQPPYALDDVSRLLRSSSGPGCSTKGLLSYFGTELHFGGVAVVNPAFRQRLQRFEQTVNDVALATYGRRPLLIRHRGAFACRSRRGQPALLSEHALGNAIDVSGFDFGPATGADSAPLGTPPLAFSVSVAHHWQNEQGDESQRHARFLRSVVARLLARGDVFRGIITPADASHTDHFHFDMAPRNHVRL
jgi:hypothetical protein